MYKRTENPPYIVMLVSDASTVRDRKERIGWN
jgi:hypothetical protein